MNNDVTWDNLDWTALHRLRETFIAGEGGLGDYWRSEVDLAGYDLTFGQRISWKWNHVIGELGRLGWTPPSGAVLDWGCGTAVASRAWLRHWGGGENAPKVMLSDRSELALRFARRRIALEFPATETSIVTAAHRQADIVLLSHVITELTDDQLNGLVAKLRTAAAVVWVEPGTKVAADRLVRVREMLRGDFQPVAPCTHAAACGMLAGENSRHWCHHFASTPPEVFTSGHWTKFGQLTGIDLRILPLSYLVMDKRPRPALPSGATRVIGEPRMYKGYARLLCCDALGVHERRLTQRVFPEPYRQIKKGRFDCLQVIESVGNEIHRLDPL